MRWTDVIAEETEERDRARRREAVEEYHRIIHWLERGGNGLRNHDGTYFAKGDAIGLRHPDLYVAFALGKGSARYHSEQSGNAEKAIVIDCLSPHDTHVRDVARAMRNEIARSNFVHEYTHFLDDIEGQHLGSTDVEVQSDASRYFNDRGEVEAFYQQAMYAAEHAFSVASPRDLAKLKNVDDETLASMVADRFLRQDFVSHLSDAWVVKLRDRVLAFTRETLRPIIQQRAA